MNQVATNQASMYQDKLALAAQRAYSATLGRGALALAVTGAGRDSGSGEMAEAIARAGAAFGKKVLLVRAVAAASNGRDLGTDISDVMEQGRELTCRLWLLEVPAGTTLHALLNDGRSLTGVLAKWTERFDGIVIDCPPYGEHDTTLYTPLTASAADAVLLVALPGTMARNQFEEIRRWLAESGAELSALILNDRKHPTLAEEIIREFGRVERFFPGLQAKVAARVHRWPPLNRYN